MVDAFKCSGSSPTSGNGAPILHGRGLAQVRERIREAFNTIHSNPGDMRIEVMKEVLTKEDAANPQKEEEEATQPLAERASPYLKAAVQLVQRRRPAKPSSNVHLISVPTESAEELIEQAIKAMEDH